MTKKEEQLEESKTKEKPEEKKVVKEFKLDINELAGKIVQKAVEEMRKDFVNLAYRVFALELVVYGLMNKGSIPKEFREDILKQEDILNANVEVMLKRMKEIEQKAKEDAENKLKNPGVEEVPKKESKEEKH
jgi:hypothetical protein